MFVTRPKPDSATRGPYPLRTAGSMSGAYTYGSYPDIDGLFREQASELDRKKREAILHRIQQLIYEKVRRRRRRRSIGTRAWWPRYRTRRCRPGRGWRDPSGILTADEFAHSISSLSTSGISGRLRRT